MIAGEDVCFGGSPFIEGNALSVDAGEGEREREREEEGERERGGEKRI